MNLGNGFTFPVLIENEYIIDIVIIIIIQYWKINTINLSLTPAQFEVFSTAKLKLVSSKVLLHGFKDTCYRWINHKDNVD